MTGCLVWQLPGYILAIVFLPSGNMNGFETTIIMDIGSHNNIQHGIRTLWNSEIGVLPTHIAFQPLAQVS